MISYQRMTRNGNFLAAWWCVGVTGSDPNALSAASAPRHSATHNTVMTLTILQLHLSLALLRKKLILQLALPKKSSAGRTMLHTALQVDLILMGERYRKMLEDGVDPVQQAETDRSASGIVDTVSQLHCIPYYAIQLCPPAESTAKGLL